MKQLQIIVSVLFGFLLATALPSAALGKDGRNLQVTAGGAKRVALVIGNDRYQHVTELKNAVADARAMAAALERAGFTVMLKPNADLAGMKQAVRQFKSSLSGGDEAIVFYSGHGVQLGAANYLLPVDITSDNEEQVKDDAIPLQRLLDDLQDQKVKFALAIVDACRDNPFKGSGRSIGGTRGLAPTSAANGEMVIFSAGAGQQALDKLGAADRESNGVFTRVFLQEMERPGVEVHQVLRNVRSRVVQMAKSVNHDQMPAIYDQVEGDFFFHPGSGTQVASLEPIPAPARIKSREEIEQDTWESARDSSNAVAIQEYLKQYPKGRFAGQARVLIATLKGGGTKPAEPVAVNISRSDGESDLWAEVQKGNSVEDYLAYLDSYPKGKYAALAKARMNRLEAEAAQAAQAQREAAAQQEQRAWDVANTGATESAYQNYLNQYPQGRYISLAQVRIDKIRKDAALVDLERKQAQAAVVNRPAISSQTAYGQMPELAKQRTCTACHAIDKRIVGPAWRDVAAKYRGTAGAEDRLVSKVTNGGSGSWGSMPMPPMGSGSLAVPQSDIRALVQFILSL